MRSELELRELVIANEEVRSVCVCVCVFIISVEKLTNVKCSEKCFLSYSEKHSKLS
jgi:hypothetical protein